MAVAAMKAFVKEMETPRFDQTRADIFRKCKTNILKLQNVPPERSEAQVIRDEIERSVPRGLYATTNHHTGEFLYKITGLIYSLKLPANEAVKVVCEPVDAPDTTIPEYISLIEFLGPCDCRGQECAPRFWRIDQESEAVEVRYPTTSDCMSL
jgi:hypothetical protein